MFRFFFPVLAVAGLLSGPAQAASVEYLFQAPADGENEYGLRALDSLAYESFDYTAPGFITGDTTVDAASANCSVAFGTCTSVEFNPTSSSDKVTINYTYDDALFATSVRVLDLNSANSSSDDYNFGTGTFTKAGGPYVSNDDFPGQLTVIASNVSPVPLPSSAPMFGAALLALGAVGYGLKRKGKAAA